MSLSIALTLLAVGLLVAPLQTWLMLGGDVTEYLRYETLPGQVLYVLSKLSALFAIELIWLQAMLGLLRYRLMQRTSVTPVVWRRMHGTLGLTALAAIAAHVVLFVVGASMRNKVAVVDLLLPWGHGAYRTWVAFGAAALWLIVVGSVVQLARMFSAATRRRLHRLNLAAIALVGVHSLAIGSESRSGPMAWTYGAMAAMLLIALVVRLFGGRASAKGLS